MKHFKLSAQLQGITEHQLQMDLSNIPNGLYLLTVINAHGGISTYPLAIQH